MIKQVIDVDGYWEVIVYYLDDGLLVPVWELGEIDFPEREIRKIERYLKSGKAKAVTCSNEGKHTSVVIFGKHRDVYDYINSIVHEAEHVKQAMLRAYDVEDRGEPPAYTVGYLVMRMMKGLHKMQTY